MKKLFYFLLILPLLFSLSSSQVCVAIDTTDPTQCSYCGYQYFVNDQTLFASITLFPYSTCALKTNIFYQKTVYVNPSATCTVCDGSPASPFQNLYDAIISASFTASQYTSSQLDFYLLGSTHYITRNKILTTGPHMFKKINASISIQACLCSVANISGCFQSTDLGPTVYVKSEDFKFFITNSLKINQVVFDNSDGHLTTLTDTNNCVNTMISCCNATTINNPSFNTATLSCAISNVTLIQRANIQKTLGLFNLFYEIDNPTAKIPGLLVTNSNFINFYSIIEDPTGGLNAGIAVFFGFYNNLPGILQVSEVVIDGGFYRFGMLQRTNQDSITHYLINNSANTYQLDLNATLALASQMTFNYFTLQNYNTPKIIYTDPSGLTAFGGLYFIDQIPGYLQINNSVINLVPQITAGILYTDPDIYSMNFTIMISGLQVYNATSYYLMTLLNCVQYVFSNNTFRYNNVSTYAFVIRYNPYFIFFNSTVEGPFLPANEFFSIESSIFNLTNSTFLNLQTTPGYYFIFTTTQIYVSSDVQFASSIASPVPYATDQIMIQSSYFENCSFLIFSNTDSVLYFIIKDSYFKYQNMNASISGVALTCEREVVFDNMTLDEMTHQEYWITLYAGRNFTMINCHVINSHLINFIMLMVVIPLDYTIFPWVYCNITNNIFSNINIIKNIQNASLTQVVQFIESQPISRGFGFHYALFINNTFEEILDTTQAADYLLYFSSGHANMTDNYFSNTQLLENVRFFPRIPNSILYIQRNKFSLMKYFSQHFFIITIGYYVDQLFIQDCYFTAGQTFNFSSGLEFLNVGIFVIQRTILSNIQSLTGNALTVNTNSTTAFFVQDCYFYFNAGANSNGADIVLGVANIEYVDWTSVDFNNMYFGITNTTFDSAQASGSLTLMDNGELLIYNSTFKNIIGDSGAVLNIGSTCRIYVSNIYIYNISADDNGGCFTMMTTEFYLIDSVIEMAGTTQIGGVIIATETSIVYLTNLQVNNTFSLKGGVVSTEDTNLTIVNSNFGFSNSSSQGGHFYLKSSNIIFTNVNLTQGFSLTAGSIYGELVTLNFTNVTVTNCQCDLVKGLGTIHLIGSDYSSSISNLLCENNVAMTGTCIFAKDIIIYIDNSLFLGNYAAVRSIIEIFFSSLTTEIIISDSLFYNNTAVSSVINSKITNVTILNTKFTYNLVYTALLLLDQVYLNIYEVQFISLLDPMVDVYLIYLTNSNYALITQSNFEGNNSLASIYCMSCLILILENITIYDGIATYGAGIRATSSAVFLTTVNFINNTASQGGGAVYLEDSWINITNTIFRQNSVAMSQIGIGADIYCNNAQIYKYSLYTLYISDSNTSQLLGTSIYVTYSNIWLNNFNFYGINSLAAGALDCQDCIQINITNALFSNLINTSAMLIENDEVETTYLILSQVMFSDCSSLTDGAFLNIIGDVHVLATYTEFCNGYAMNRGGAIYFENSLNFSESCFIFSNVLFLNNTANANGGAIYTAYTLVGIEQNVTFTNNNASNGINIYSYPSQLLIVQNTGEDISQLQEYVANQSFIQDYKAGVFNTKPVFYTKSGDPFSFGILIIDNYDNVLDTETDTICEIKDIGAVAVDVENNIAKLSAGMAIFTRVSIVEKSDETYNFLIQYSGNNNFQNLSIAFDIFVQKCGRGEIFNENLCTVCEESFYSLEADPEAYSILMQNKTMECNTCPVLAYCPGGDKIIPNDGYWRMNSNTSLIVKCYPPESCPYQANWENTSTINFSITFQCGIGYEGNLCTNCETGYGEYHTGCFSCWAKDNYHYALYFFKFLFMVFLIVYETYGALKKEHSVSKCLIRIYLNHTIYLIAFTGLNLSLDDETKDLFGQINSNLSIIPSDIFNFHCLLASSTTQNDMFSANLAIQTIIPILYGSICFFIKTAIDKLLNFWNPKKYKRPNKKKIIYNLIITFYLAYRNWYPRVLMSTMDLFECIDLGDPNYEYLQVDPDIACWADNHKKLLVGTILPSIIVWVILVPSCTFYYLRKNRKLLAKRDTYLQENETRRQASSIRKSESVKEKIQAQPSVSDRSGVIGEGGEKIKKGESIFFYWIIDYQKKYYLWVVIENLIAFSLLFISQVISGLEDKIQRMIMFICFAVLFLVYQKLEPFQQKINNTIASFSIAIALFTIIFQMIGANENNSSNIVDFSVGMIILCNMFFYLGALIIVILYNNRLIRRKIYGFFRGAWRYMMSFCKR